MGLLGALLVNLCASWGYHFSGIFDMCTCCEILLDWCEPRWSLQTARDAWWQVDIEERGNLHMEVVAADVAAAGSAAAAMAAAFPSWASVAPSHAVRITWKL